MTASRLGSHLNFPKATPAEVPVIAVALSAFVAFLPGTDTQPLWKLLKMRWSVRTAN